MVNQLLLSASYYTAFFNANNLNAALNAFPTTWSFADGLCTQIWAAVIMSILKAARCGNGN